MTDETQQPITDSSTAGTPPNSEAATSWLGGIPEAYRANPAITRYASMDAFMAGHVGYDKHFGVTPDSLMKLPKPDAPTEEWGAVYDRLGRPKAATDYAFNGIDLKNEGDKVFVEGFRAKAHEIGLSQKQMDGIMGYLGQAFTDSDAAEVTAQQARIDGGKADLKTAWGDKFDIYANEVPAIIQRLAGEAGIIDLKADPEAGKALMDKLHDSGLTNDPTFMRLMAKVTDMVAEPGTLTGNGRATEASMSAAQAETAKMALLGNEAKLNALHDRNDPLHKEVLAERDRLNAIITGQNAA